MTGSQTPNALLVPGLCWAWIIEATLIPAQVLSVRIGYWAGLILLWLLRAKCLPALVWSL